MTLYLQDVGVISALGAGKAELLSRLLACDSSGMVPYGPLLAGGSTWVAPVRSPLPELPEPLAEFDCRNNRLLAVALDQIAASVAAQRERWGPRRVAVLMGTSTSGIANGEDAAESLARRGHMPEGYHYRQQEIGSVAEFAARYLGLAGLRYTISTACSSSAKVFASAQRLLAAGRCDAAVVGGADSLCRLTLNGFDSLESLARGVCNPFSANRKGINIGEGACVFVVTREPAPIRLCGVGESSDGYHISAPDPTGRGAELALRAALEQAGVSAPRRRLRESAWHRDAEERRDGSRGRGARARVRNAVRVDEAADRPYARRGRRTRARDLLVAARRCERGAAPAAARVGRRSRPGARADRARRARRTLGARRVRVELVRVRRQQRHARDRAQLMDD